MSEYSLEILTNYVKTTKTNDNDQTLKKAEGFLKAKNKNAAFAEFKKLWELTEKKPKANNKVKSHILYQLGKTAADRETAIKYYRKALIYDPKHTNVLFNLAALHQHDEHLTAAILFLKVYQLDPKDKEAQKAYENHRVFILGKPKGLIYYTPQEMKEKFPEILMKAEEIAQEINLALNAVPQTIDLTTAIEDFLIYIDNNKSAREIIEKLNLSGQQKALLLNKFKK